MICELFPFQKQAVNEMRLRVAMALNNYRMLKIPQVVSLQAPTGSGKTIIMSALIEDIFYGSEQFTEQPEAIFVWLSDSPQLNEQSKQKIELKADKVRMDQCVVISDESFDREILEDGHISVSYTHLDVYKRQKQSIVRGKNIQCRNKNFRCWWIFRQNWLKERETAMRVGRSGTT